MAEEINFIRPQEVYDRNNGESKVRYRSYDGNDRFIPVVDGEKGVPKTMVEVTHAELKAMRDGGKLTAGALYRITDYQCTTTQENTQSAGHQFDIVLLALSENKLAEEGWVMHHAGDTYFANSNLSAWKVWYCLDNDKSRFAWADDSFKLDSEYITIGNNVTVDGIALTTTDKFYRNPEEDSVISFMGNMPCYAWTSDKVTLFTTELVPDTNSQLRYGDDKDLIDADHVSLYVGGYYTEYDYDSPNGRGVIYRLIDEWNNDVPYDFKNIMLSVGTGKDSYGYLFSLINHIGDTDYSINGTFRNVSIAQYLAYSNVENKLINTIELGILAPSIRSNDILRDIKIASGILTSNEQIDQLSSHSIMGYSIESSKESSKT